MIHDLVVVDYGAGNLHSVAKALRAIGADPYVTSDASELERARSLVLPGVGAAGQIMRSLRELELDDPIRDFITSGRPFLGVCMGLQVLLDRSAEDGGQECLGVVSGTVERLAADSLKIPHMGWNSVQQVRPHPLWRGIPDHSYFYFVHSFAAVPEDSDVVSGTTEYGHPFVSAIAHQNVFCTQFHPEKSSKLGLQFYRNFLEWASI